VLADGALTDAEPLDQFTDARLPYAEESQDLEARVVSEDTTHPCDGTLCRAQDADHGWELVRGEAAFADARTLEAGGRRIRADGFVIASGASPAIPDIPGLSEAGLPDQQ